MNKFHCDSCGKKIPKTAATPATKREVTRAMKESADLWEALSETECKLNVIVGYLLRFQQGEGSEGTELVKIAVEMTPVQAEQLHAIRGRLLSYDAMRIFPATDEGA